MLQEQSIDDLIQAGWDVLDSDFDMGALLKWKRTAHKCMSALLGPDHEYTQHFQGYVGHAAHTDRPAKSKATGSGVGSCGRSPLIHHIGTAS